jgi:hypothetical protein
MDVLYFEITVQLAQSPDESRNHNDGIENGLRI